MGDHPTVRPGEERLSLAIRRSAPAVWDLDLATGEFIVSERVRSIYGLAAGAQVSLDAFIAATHPHDLAWTAALRKPGPATVAKVAEPIRYRIQRADTGEVRWMHAHVDVAWADQAGRVPAGFTGTIEDITELIQATHALVESEERLRLAIEAGRMAVWEVELSSGKLTNTRELNLLLGLPEDAMPTFEDVRRMYAPGEKERLDREGATLEIVRQRSGSYEMHGAHAPGTDRTQLQAEVSVITPAGLNKRLLLRAQYASTDSRSPKVTGVLVDITERKHAEERLATVARELQHRVKNSLAVVQMLALQSFRQQRDPAISLEAFMGRLRALAATNEVILDSGWSDADFGEIADRITSPYRSEGSDPFQLRGERIVLPGKAASAISMVLHELATNAAKYGSLSVPGGRVMLEWSRRPTGGIEIHWTERGGPPVQQPGRQGFGTRLLETLVSAELGGSVNAEYHPAGLHCRIRTGSHLATG